MDTDLSAVFASPARRRFWLLTKALEDAPLDVALVRAKSAEAFVTGCADAHERAKAACLTTFRGPLTWMH
jgi:hypothetical protein